MKKKFLIIIVFIVIIILPIYIIMFSGQSDLSITFYNKTNQEIENLKVNLFSNNESKITSLPTINPNQKIDFKIKLNDNFNEGSIELIYFDADGKKHKETIVGYIIKGESSNPKLYIESIDDKGIIEFNIKE